MITKISPHIKDIGDFIVRRALPQVGFKSVGPWVFFDHFGPVEFAPGKGMDVRPHPHINLATVTYLFEGEIFHRDSLGNAMAIAPGAINLMVAGRGIVHSERSREEIRTGGQRLHGLQLWHALPSDAEETAPEFLHYPEAVLPRLRRGGCDIRVMMGSAYGVSSPVKTFAPTLYVEAMLPKGARLDCPQAQELAVYVVSGEIEAGGEVLSAHELGRFDGAPFSELVARADSRIAFIGGASLGRRYIEWNFVSSRPERIAQAKADWAAGRFPKVPGDEAEFIPLP